MSRNQYYRIMEGTEAQWGVLDKATQESNDKIKFLHQPVVVCLFLPPHMTHQLMHAIFKQTILGHVPRTINQKNKTAVTRSMVMVIQLLTVPQQRKSQSQDHLSYSPHSQLQRVLRAAGEYGSGRLSEDRPHEVVIHYEVEFSVMQLSGLPTAESLFTYIMQKVFRWALPQRPCSFKQLLTLL